MTGTIKVKELNSEGIYVTRLDHDESFIDKDNPRGNFKMVIEPSSSVSPELRYKKLDDGYLVQGEGYIVAGSTAEISRSVLKHYEKVFSYGSVKMIKDASLKLHD